MIPPDLYKKLEEAAQAFMDRTENYALDSAFLYGAEWMYELLKEDLELLQTIRENQGVRITRLHFENQELLDTLKQIEKMGEVKIDGEDALNMQAALAYEVLAKHQAKMETK